MAVYIDECKVDLNGSVALQTVLQVFDAAIKEERAWAVLYQSAITCESLLDSNHGQELLAIVSEPSHLLIHTDGHVHRTSFESTESTRKQTFDESKLINGLGWTLFAALDFGVSDQESRILSPDLDQIIDLMTSAGCEESEDRHCTDDEGIEQDAGDRISFSFIRKRCQHQISSTAAPSQADAHYRAVCRALVAETLEFSQFLSRVTKNPDDWRELRSGTEFSCVELGQLHLSDWARLWLQVMRQLRNGVKLKKTDLTHKPIEYELTPYEMLMEDIRTRRYHLRKVTVDQKIPPQVKKDAHQLILEFIRSRPPLKKVSERRLNPRVRKPTSKELLLQSIQSYNPQCLRPTRSHSPAPVQGLQIQERPKLKRLKPEINFSDFLNDDDDLDDIPDHPPYDDASRFADSSVIHRDRPGLRRHHSLAQLPSCTMDRLPATARRISAFGAMESLPTSSGPSSSTSSISSASTPGSPTLPVLSTLMEHMQLGEDFLDPARFNEEFNCLSLTVEELVHIRHVLTKAELDSLPLDNGLKNDLVHNKVCFVCRKTRFGIFGPWGSQCKFCQRTVCKKCSYKMEVPSKPFASVPVFSLTPTSPTLPSCKSYCLSGPTSLVNFSTNPAAGDDPGISAPGSAPSSPAARRRRAGMSRPKSMYLGDNQWQAVPDETPKRPGLKKSLTFLRRDSQNPRPRTECAVCKDCHNLIVRHINYSAAEDAQRPCSSASERTFESLN